MIDPNASAAPLPLSALIEAAYGRLFSNLGVFIRIALAWTGVTIGLFIIIGILAPQAWDGPAGTLVGAVVGAGTAIGWHRFVLREERRALSRFNTLARYVVLATITALPGLAIVLIGTPAVATLLRGVNDRTGATAMTVTIILLVAAGFAVTFRLSLILPAVAIGDRSMTFRRSWAATRGHAVRILIGCIAVQIPPWLGIGLLSWLFDRRRQAPHYRAAEIGAADYIFALAGGLCWLLLAALATALFAGFLSELYLRLCQDSSDVAPAS